LRSEGIVDTRPPEVLGREAGDTREAKIFAGRNRVADRKEAVIGNADDVAGIGLLHPIAILRQEDRRVVETHLPAEPGMPALIPRSNLPEQIRRKAIRSR
jgi:hypothetical protein